MRTFTEWFKVRLVEGAQSEEQLMRALGNWVEQLIKNPHLDDIRTWVSMVRKLSPQIRSAFMLDMVAAIDKVIGRLPREDQAKAERLVASVDDSYHVQNQMVARGLLPTMERPGRFYTPQQLEDYLARAMDAKYPNLEIIDQVGQENKDHWENLGDEFKAAFKSWLKDEFQKRKAQSAGVNWVNLMKKQLEGPPDGE
jgi:hypothetical protein